MAKRGFTGAPAITIEQAPDYFADLYDRWIITEQYFKPYPVCRWAQSPVEGVLTLRRAHGLTAKDVDHIRVETFHESCRLATAEPKNTEQAQYSTSFPCAVALVRGSLTPADIGDDALHDPEILRVSRGLRMEEHEHANTNFPAERLSRVALVLKNGTTLQGEWMNPLWAPDAPPDDDALIAKFHNLSDPVLGADRAQTIREAVWNLDQTPLSELTRHLSQSP